MTEQSAPATAPPAAAGTLTSLLQVLYALLYVLLGAGGVAGYQHVRAPAPAAAVTAPAPQPLRVVFPDEKLAKLEQAVADLDAKVDGALAGVNKIAEELEAARRRAIAARAAAERKAKAAAPLSLFAAPATK